ncbi:hypothetical protein AL387_gp188 [Salmon gill poxvirus]|uniref:Uncharacterized protein n=1 Tax=Salmon gill poxvirus TaxID=1680908 RepID=A0A0H4Y1L3_9POXV|nr:hypothetical protein AL387_gp188 [Salmon gill poxvirus]AKR04312.1 hypothetical protein SGPV188 [Salmon gill poxvirus]
MSSNVVQLFWDVCGDVDQTCDIGKLSEVLICTFKLHNWSPVQKTLYNRNAHLLYNGRSDETKAYANMAWDKQNIMVIYVFDPMLLEKVNQLMMIIGSKLKVTMLYNNRNYDKIPIMKYIDDHVIYLDSVSSLIVFDPLIKEGYDHVLKDLDSWKFPDNIKTLDMFIHEMNMLKKRLEESTDGTSQLVGAIQTTRKIMETTILNKSAGLGQIKTSPFTSQFDMSFIFSPVDKKARYNPDYAYQEDRIISDYHINKFIDNLKKCFGGEISRVLNSTVIFLDQENLTANNIVLLKENLIYALSDWADRLMNTRTDVKIVTSEDHWKNFKIPGY